MSCIVGLNDGADEQNKWVRVLKDVEEVCLRHGGQRRSHAADVVLNRVNNEVQLGKDGVPEPLLGREGNQEKQALHKIRRIQKIARGTAENERTLEAAMFQVRPSKLIVPSRDEPLSMFDPATWGMSFPDLFPWGDGLPFLKRDTNMDAIEVFRYLLLREELQYGEDPALLPRWSLSEAWIRHVALFNVVFGFGGILSFFLVVSFCCFFFCVLELNVGRCAQETLLPVMYDVQRRLQLMRATKAHVMRRGFGKHCRVISEVSADQLLKAMALHGENADLRELMRDPAVDVALKRALGGVLQATSSIIGMEGHRSQIRLRGHAAGWHYGSAHLFVTPNIADVRSSLLLQLHLQRSKAEECNIDLDWEKEMPELPTAAAMRRIVAQDPVAQARCFALMMDVFCEEVLGILPPLTKGSFRVGVAATFEDGIASSLQGGVFGEVAALNGPLETQGRGSLHPHMLIVLLGHDLGDRLRHLMHRVQHGELVVELQRWSHRVLDAVRRFQYDSQFALSEQLSSPTQPLPFNERQRSECGRQYDSTPLVPTEPDGHEVEALKKGGSVASKVLTLTGCYASLRPLYLRRSERSAGDGLEWKRRFCEDYRRLVIQNHFHKCTKSCFKKNLARNFAYLFFTSFVFGEVIFFARVYVYELL